MRILILALALFIAAPSQADETDLPLWYKEKALLKSYNLLVKKANQRRDVIIRLCECDPSDENIALAKATRQLSKADTFSDVPERYRDYENNTLSDDQTEAGQEKNHYFRLLLKCQRTKQKSEG